MMTQVTLMKFRRISQKQMQKKIVRISIYVIVGAIIGFLVARIPSLEIISFDTKIPIFDVISLLITIAMAFYVAQILEKDVQNSQQGKQMYLDRINQNEEILLQINEYLQTDTILLTRVTNLLHRFRSRQTSINKALKERIKKDIFKTEQDALEADIRDLKRLLTDTPIDNTDTSNISIRNGVVKYSKNRLTEISTCVLNIDNQLFDLKHQINNLL